jgi:hypothetical protein|tara:strand:+ start:158 stop:688 length:531 start_codon:yes stop_codon:yes gene_type:complete
MKFQSIKTSKLNKTQIVQILNLKNTHWKHGYESQLIWFKKNALPSDSHNLMLINNEIVGYTFLANRSLKIFHLNKMKEKVSYTLFATLILSKKYRNFFYVSKFMKFNSKIIIKKNYPSFLLCQERNLKLYKFFNWLSLDVLNFKVPDHSKNLKGMIYNFDDFKKDKNTVYNFYYYS